MLRVAVIDMYDGTPNLGLGSILEMLDRDFPDMSYDVFDIRQHHEVPDLSYDIYINTGGPGHPLQGNDAWEDRYFALLDGIHGYNAAQDRKKFVFFICHSFQIACHYYGVGKVTRRPMESFGIVPVLKTSAGLQDRLLRHLPQPFYAADFRAYQVVDPNPANLESVGIEILAMEDPSHHDFPDLAVMAIKFGETVYGTQFHPEAYMEGMLDHFDRPDRKKQILEKHGSHAYEEMMFHLRDPIKVELTHQTVLPGFLRFASKTLSSEPVTME